MLLRSALILASVLLAVPLAAQSKAKAYVAPRTADGKPDLQGIWEARNTAAGSVEAHSASAGFRAGESVIVDPADGKIPYLASALATREANFKKRASLDPWGNAFSPAFPASPTCPIRFKSSRLLSTSR
jgi:hypothetical protein